MISDLNYKSSLVLVKIYLIKNNINNATHSTEEHTQEDRDGIALAHKNMKISNHQLISR